MCLFLRCSFLRPSRALTPWSSRGHKVPVAISRFGVCSPFTADPFSGGRWPSGASRRNGERLTAGGSTQKAECLRHLGAEKVRRSKGSDIRRRDPERCLRRVTFLVPPKKVTKECGPGEALRAKAPSPGYPTRRLPALRNKEFRFWKKGEHFLKVSPPVFVSSVIAPPRLPVIARLRSSRGNLPVRDTQCVHAAGAVTVRRPFFRFFRHSRCGMPLIRQPFGLPPSPWGEGFWERCFDRGDRHTT